MGFPVGVTVEVRGLWRFGTANGRHSIRNFLLPLDSRKRGGDAEINR